MDDRAIAILIRYSMAGRKTAKREFITYMLQMTLIANHSDFLRPEDKEELEKYIGKERSIDLKWALTCLKEYLFSAKP